MATLSETTVTVLDSPPPWTSQSMYAIAFDLDTEELARRYGASSWQNAYRDVRDLLLERGFTWQQGGVQFGGPAVTPVTCVLAVQELGRRYAWFAPCVRDIRMLRIEENNDLRAALG